MRALLCPNSLKGVLTAAEAAAALAEGFRRVPGWEAEELPVADGGEGTAEVLHRVLGGAWHEADVSDPLGRPVTARFLVTSGGMAVLDAAEAVGLGLLAVSERDPLIASSSGLGELLEAVLAIRPLSVLVGLGGTATVDGGAGLLTTLSSWPNAVPLRVACDVRNPLLGDRGAARVFGPQKGASPQGVEELERRLAEMVQLRAFAHLRGAGAGGGLGAALAALGGTLEEGAELVLDAVGFDRKASGADLVVTGEGRVDATTFEGKTPGAVRARCDRLGVRCVLFGGQVASEMDDAIALSGNPHHALADMASLGELLGSRLPDS